MNILSRMAVVITVTALMLAAAPQQANAQDAETQNQTHLSEITVDVSTPGTLLDQILLQTAELGDVVTLHLKGQINNDDVSVLKNRLKHMRYLDMKELQVKTLGSNFMEGNDTLRSVVLPDMLVSIGENAFYACTHLENVSMPEGLVTISTSAFGYTALTEVIVPSTVRHARSIFYQSPNLKRIICKSFAPPASVGRNFISGTGRELLKGVTLIVPKGAVDTYKSVTGYDNYEFYETIDNQPNVMYVGGSSMKMNTNGIWKKMDAYVYLVTGGGYNGYEGMGSLTVTGDSLLNLGTLSMYYDMYVDWDYKGSRNEIASNPYGTVGYQFGTPDCIEYSRNFSCLLAHAPIRADKISINMVMRPSRWHFISLPFDMRVGDLQVVNGAENGATYVAIRRYDGAQRAAANMENTWVELDDDDMMEAGKGYIVYAVSKYEQNGEVCSKNPQLVFSSANTTNKNKIFAFTDAAVPIEQHPAEYSHNSNWNLMGNPYPCYINATAVGHDGIIIIRNVYRNKYEALSLTDDVYVLSPLEAFFIQTPTGKKELTFDGSGRQTRVIIENGTASSRSSEDGQHSERLVLNLTLTSGKDADRTRIVINPKAKLDYEIGRDAPKMAQLDGEALSFYSLQSGMTYAINERPIGDGVIALGMQIADDGQYTIDLSSKEYEKTIILEDRALGNTTILNEGGYSFYAMKSDNMQGRFFLHVEDETSAIHSMDLTREISEKTYNMQGQHVKDAKKGVYIRNGRKVIVK